jgi:hypothetical protein
MADDGIGAAGVMDGGPGHGPRPGRRGSPVPASADRRRSGALGLPQDGVAGTFVQRHTREHGVCRELPPPGFFGGPVGGGKALA